MLVIVTLALTKPTWLTAAILEMPKQVYLSNFLTDLHQILFADRYSTYKGHWGRLVLVIVTLALTNRRRLKTRLDLCIVVLAVASLLSPL